LVVEFDPSSEYPLGQKRPDLVATPSGRPLDEVTLAEITSGRLGWEDVRATPETLARQAAVALAAGRPSLADNLSRAAELATIPDETILQVYGALRPHRSTSDELEAWAARLDGLGAPLSAAFVREAVQVYAERGLLRAREPATV
jgi:propanediol dehydratase small subunit